MLAVVAIALIGGIVPALPAALAAGLLADYYFTPPLHSLRVERLVDILTLVIYVVTAAIVGTAAGAAAHRTYQAVRASSVARALSRLATAMMHGQDLPALLEQVREDFGLDAVSLLERDARHAAEHTRASLLLTASRDLRDPLRSAEEALHHLRTPTDAQQARIRDSARSSVRRAGRLVTDLDELSRHAGALDLYLRPVDLDEALTAVLDALGPAMTCSAACRSTCRT
ncbi:DUF4118 domain-containing protein [Streptomyces sp. XY332]|uniref:DUF4118 domain-containing protein n=1 Tax=Streptomyces sp. XY332 TaxID=1415561 RepID=UPI0006B190D0|nr:DUF4118 domain-containing protein [Streptomyces sp. XY332]